MPVMPKMPPEEEDRVGGLTFEEEQAERREYVKNIEIEYQFGCFEEKQPDSCQLLGEFMEAVRVDYKEAFRLFDNNCTESRQPRSCFKVGTYIVSGREPSGDFEKAMKALDISCNAEKPVPQACRLLGLIHWNGEQGRDPQPKVAEQCMRRACDLREGDACWTLSTWHMGSMGNDTLISSSGKEIRKGHLRRDMEKALEFGIRACELNVFQACGNVSRMYKLGDGIPKDAAKADEYKRKAVDIVESIKEGFNAGFTA